MKRIMWRRWLENLFPFARTPKAGKNRASTRLDLERLEDRLVPAGPFNVTNTLDTGTGSLRKAISDADAAGGASTINVKVSGPITLTSGQLKINSGSEITVLGLAGLSTIDGTNNSRIFEVYGGNSLSLQNLILTRGEVVNSGGGDDWGGAIRVDGSPAGDGYSLKMSNCQITNSENVGNSNDDAFGGAIYVDSDSSIVNIDKCLFKNDQATTSGGEGSPVNAYGGAIASYGGLSISNSTFSQNTAHGDDSYGGGAFGGAIALFNFSSTAKSITGSTFDHNTAQGGDDTSGNNGGIAQGGAVRLVGSAVAVGIANSTFAFNTAQGGAPGSESTGGLALGGGLFLQTLNDSSGSGCTLVNDTIAFNKAMGGPEVLDNGSTAGSDYGGGIATGAEGEGAPSLLNTIVAKNTTTSGSEPDVGFSGSSGTFDSLGHNLIGSSSFAGNFSTGNHDIFPISGTLDPGFVSNINPLQNNGGPTQTIAISKTSKAFDNGDDQVVTTVQSGLSATLTTDQRGVGFGRLVFGHVDIGAYEIQNSITLTLRRTAPFTQILSLIPADVFSLLGLGSSVNLSIVQLFLVPGSVLPGTFKLNHSGSSFTFTPGAHTNNFSFQVSAQPYKHVVSTGSYVDVGCVLTVNIVFIGGRSSSEVFLGL